MNISRVFAAAAAVAISFASTSAQAVDLHRDTDAYCRGYVIVPTSFALTYARAGIVASSSFHHPNRFRAHLGPVHYVKFYDPIRACKILARKHKKHKKYKRR